MNRVGYFVTCPTCRGEPLKFSHELLADSYRFLATMCETCHGVGMVAAAVKTPTVKGGG